MVNHTGTVAKDAIPTYTFSLAYTQICNNTSMQGFLLLALAQWYVTSLIQTHVDSHRMLENYAHGHDPKYKGMVVPGNGCSREWLFQNWTNEKVPSSFTSSTKLLTLCNRQALCYLCFDSFHFSGFRDHFIDSDDIVL